MMDRPISIARPGGITAVVFAAAVLVAPHGLRAADQTFLGQHNDWYAYSLEEDGAKTCYMVSKPQRSAGDVPQRGDVVAFVTHRPKDGERDVVSFQAGYTYKSGSDVEVTIADGRFSLFTSRDTAWARNPTDDKALVQSMIKGITMRVRGTPARGETTTDTYSLRGFTAAHKEITSACGLK